MTPVPLYDSFSKDYDRFVNWEGRLKLELPFLSTHLRRVNARRVLDVACGTGRHTIALAQAGYDALGADPSQPMIDVAVKNAASAGAEAGFVVAGFGQLEGKVGAGFDALICLGNSLPHALSAAALREAVQDFRSTLKPGGILIIQNRNFDRVSTNRERFMAPESYLEGEKEWVFLRFYDFEHDEKPTPETIRFNVVTLRRQGRQWSLSSDSSLLRPILREEMEAILTGNSFRVEAVLGNLAGDPFDPIASENLVTVAQAV